MNMLERGEVEGDRERERSSKSQISLRHPQYFINPNYSIAIIYAIMRLSCLTHPAHRQRPVFTYKSSNSLHSVTSSLPHCQSRDSTFTTITQPQARKKVNLTTTQSIRKALSVRARGSSLFHRSFGVGSASWLLLRLVHILMSRSRKMWQIT